MKRISILLAVCLLLSIPVQAAASALFQYKSDKLGFSVAISGVSQNEIIAEETDTSVNFYHAQSREKYGGEIGSIEVVSPRSDFFSKHYDDIISAARLMAGQFLRASFSIPRMAEKTGTRSVICLHARFLDCFSLVCRREFCLEAAKRTPASC